MSSIAEAYENLSEKSVKDFKKEIGTSKIEHKKMNIATSD